MLEKSKPALEKFFDERQVKYHSNKTNFMLVEFKDPATTCKFLKDNNINHVDKESAIVLVNGDNKIIWVIGMRLDNRFSVIENTQKLLNIEYCKKN